MTSMASIASSMSSVVPTMSSSMTPTTTSSSAATSSSSGGGGGGGTGPSSPLLFFVALGFGVVFTNLWIIVGVKYCFRYNQRNRVRMNGEDPDAVDMGAMPRQRRRREKKLMSMEEVNERFPLVKYKAWRTTRAAEGLPTAGGIADTASRPASIKHEPRISEDEGQNKEVNITNVPEPVTPAAEKPGSSEHGSPEIIRSDTISTIAEDRPTTAASNRNAVPTVVADDKIDDEETDQIQNAIPAEQLPDPGDMCAICIDTIEDDDDIRGLTCGHAFHASCVDPWLTSRRACCPLCKADYYVPKPRPEGETEELRRRETRTETHPFAQYTLVTHSRAGRMRAMVVPNRLLGGLPANRSRSRHHSGSRNRRVQQRNNTQPEVPAVTNPDEQPPTQTSENLSWRQRLGGMRLPTLPPLSRTRAGRGNEAGNQPITPAQMEEGRTIT